MFRNELFWPYNSIYVGNWLYDLSKRTWTPNEMKFELLFMNFSPNRSRKGSTQKSTQQVLVIGDSYKPSCKSCQTYAKQCIKMKTKCAHLKILVGQVLGTQSSRCQEWQREVKTGAPYILGRKNWGLQHDPRGIRSEKNSHVDGVLVTLYTTSRKIQLMTSKCETFKECITPSRWEERCEKDSWITLFS